MMTDRELMQQALEALELYVNYEGATTSAENALTALRERLEQPEQCKYPDCKCATENPCLKGLAQPQRTHWEGCEEVHPQCKQLEQEPVAHTLNCVCGAVWDISLNGAEEMVQTPDAPKPRREWVGLTDEEELMVGVATGLTGIAIRMIEAKLREKNNV